MKYGNKRDCPKIDIFYNKRYACSTTWARERWLLKNPTAKPELAKAHKASSYAH
jgi:hypothetical protein